MCLKMRVTTCRWRHGQSISGVFVACEDLKNTRLGSVESCETPAAQDDPVKSKRAFFEDSRFLSPPIFREFSTRFFPFSSHSGGPTKFCHTNSGQQTLFGFFEFDVIWRVSWGGCGGASGGVTDVEKMFSTLKNVEVWLARAEERCELGRSRTWAAELELERPRSNLGRGNRNWGTHLEQISTWSTNLDVGPLHDFGPIHDVGQCQFRLWPISTSANSSSVKFGVVNFEFGQLRGQIHTMVTRICECIRVAPTLRNRKLFYQEEKPNCLGVVNP